MARESLPGFDALFQRADARQGPVPVVAAGGDDATVLEALRDARLRGWVEPIVVGPERTIRLEAESHAIDLDGFTIVEAEGDAVGPRAVREVRRGRGQMLLKGRIATPALLRPALDPIEGLRTGRVICQVVLMEVPRDDRRFLLADTGICIRTGLPERIDILRSLVEVARALGLSMPRVAALAATETPSEAMPESVEAAELQRLAEEGAFPGCQVQGPLSFDLAYTREAAERKHVEREAAGEADALLFPDLLSANLTVKAIMYTANCRFGGILRGTAAPVVFMSRADSAATRLRSLAFALGTLGQGPRGPGGAET